MPSRSRIERMGRVYSRSKSKAAAMAVIEEEIEDLLVESPVLSVPEPCEPPPPSDADDGRGRRADHASQALSELMAGEVPAEAPPTPPVPEPAASSPQQPRQNAPRWLDWLRSLFGALASAGR